MPGQEREIRQGGALRTQQISTPRVDLVPVSETERSQPQFSRIFNDGNLLSGLFLSVKKLTDGELSTHLSLIQRITKKYSLGGWYMHTSITQRHIKNIKEANLLEDNQKPYEIREDIKEDIMAVGISMLVDIALDNQISLTKLFQTEPPRNMAFIDAITTLHRKWEADGGQGEFSLDVPKLSFVSGLSPKVVRHLINYFTEDLGLLGKREVPINTAVYAEEVIFPQGIDLFAAISNAAAVRADDVTEEKIQEWADKLLTSEQIEKYGYPSSLQQLTERFLDPEENNFYIIREILNRGREDSSNSGEPSAQEQRKTILLAFLHDSTPKTTTQVARLLHKGNQATLVTLGKMEGSLLTRIDQNDVQGRPTKWELSESFQASRAKRLVQEAGRVKIVTADEIREMLTGFNEDLIASLVKAFNEANQTRELFRRLQSDQTTPEEKNEIHNAIATYYLHRAKSIMSGIAKNTPIPREEFETIVGSSLQKAINTYRIDIPNSPQFPSYLYVIISRECIDILRKTRSESSDRLEEEGVFLTREADRFEGSVEAGIIKDQFRDELVELQEAGVISPLQRDIFFLYYHLDDSQVDRLTYEEIGKELSRKYHKILNRATVKGRETSAVERLARYFAQDKTGLHEVKFSLVAAFVKRYLANRTQK